MNIAEKELEDIIHECYQNDTLLSKIAEQGLDILWDKPNIVKRQLKIGNYGVADMVLYSKIMNTIMVFELKQKEINTGTLIQAARYAKGIREYLEMRPGKARYQIKIVLIGKTVNLGDWVYMFHFLHDVSIYTYKICLEGLVFEDVDLSHYSLIDNGLSKTNEL